MERFFIWNTKMKPLTKKGMTMKHTKGKWTIEKTKDAGFRIQSGSNIICWEGLSKLYPPLMDSQGNAKLIAAAPELLAACKLAVRYVAKMVADGVNTALPAEIALKRIEKAIEQAE